MSLLDNYKTLSKVLGKKRLLETSLETSHSGGGGSSYGYKIEEEGYVKGEGAAIPRRKRYARTTVKQGIYKGWSNWIWGFALCSIILFIFTVIYVLCYWALLIIGPEFVVLLYNVPIFGSNIFIFLGDAFLNTAFIVIVVLFILVFMCTYIPFVTLKTYNKSRYFRYGVGYCAPCCYILLLIVFWFYILWNFISFGLKLWALTLCSGQIAIMSGDCDEEAHIVMLILLIMSGIFVLLVFLFGIVLCFGTCFCMFSPLRSSIGTRLFSAVPTNSDPEKRLLENPKILQNVIKVGNKLSKNTLNLNKEIEKYNNKELKENKHSKSHNNKKTKTQSKKKHKQQQQQHHHHTHKKTSGTVKESTINAFVSLKPMTGYA